MSMVPSQDTRVMKFTRSKSLGARITWFSHAWPSCKSPSSTVMRTFSKSTASRLVSECTTMLRILSLEALLRRPSDSSSTSQTTMVLLRVLPFSRMKKTLPKKMLLLMLRSTIPPKLKLRPKPMDTRRLISLLLMVRLNNSSSPHGRSLKRSMLMTLLTSSLALICHHPISMMVSISSSMLKLLTRSILQLTTEVQLASFKLVTQKAQLLDLTEVQIQWIQALWKTL